MSITFFPQTTSKSNIDRIGLNIVDISTEGGLVHFVDDNGKTIAFYNIQIPNEMFLLPEWMRSLDYDLIYEIYEVYFNSSSIGYKDGYLNGKKDQLKSISQYIKEKSDNVCADTQ